MVQVITFDYFFGLFGFKKFQKVVQRFSRIMRGIAYVRGGNFKKMTAAA